MKFLRRNDVYNEITYNELKNKNEWMIDIGCVCDKYKKFNFKEIHPNKRNFYETREQTEKEYEIANQQLMTNIGIDKHKKLILKDKKNKINEINNRIPIDNLDLYYGKYNK
jgi:hypothetical protein